MLTPRGRKRSTMSQQLKVFGTTPAYRKGDDVADLLARAITYHRSGDLAKAQAGYKKILKKRPKQFDALYMLGVSEFQSGNSQSAEHLLRRALLVDPQQGRSQTWNFDDVARSN